MQILLEEIFAENIFDQQSLMYAKNVYGTITSSESLCEYFSDVFYDIHN